MIPQGGAPASGPPAETPPFSKLAQPNQGCAQSVSPRYDYDWVASLLDVEARRGDTTPEEFLLAAGVGPALHSAVSLH